jgi:parallel beta-helix repeat protein
MLPSRTMLTLAFVSVFAGAALAGPLAPPVGPVVSTMKPLSDVEPRVAINATNTPGTFSSVYRITIPGSYYLTGNVQSADLKSGIEIATSGVTLDLNGFVVLGTATSHDGIEVTGGNRSDITIRNGSVRGNGGSGISVTPAIGIFIERITASGNGAHGIFVQHNARILDCTAFSNGQHGFYFGDDAIISRCIGTDNGLSGTGAGFNGTSECVLESCTASGNASQGINVVSRGRIANCVASSNQTGIAASGGLITGCTCWQNTADGITVASTATVRGCDCCYNGDDGIQVADACIVAGNTCTGNGPSNQGAGVFVLGNDCRIDDNQFKSNHYGVLVNNAKINNFIVKNTATANSGGDFAVPASNNLAPVITNPGSAFSGATPWSNFAY